MTTYGGSFEAGPPDDEPAGPMPRLCTICRGSGAQQWFTVDKSVEEQAAGGGTAVARWWALCATCDALMDAQDHVGLRTRSVDDLPRAVLESFVAAARRA